MHMQWHIFQEPMQYVFKKIQVHITGEIRWKKVWPNNTFIQKPCPHVETVAILKAMRAHNTRDFIQPKHGWRFKHVLWCFGCSRDDMSSYAKPNHLGPHYEPLEFVMEI